MVRLQARTWPRGLGLSGRRAAESPANPPYWAPLSGPGRSQVGSVWAEQPPSCLPLHGLRKVISSLGLSFPTGLHCLSSFSSTPHRMAPYEPLNLL